MRKIINLRIENSLFEKRTYVLSGQKPNFKMNAMGYERVWQAVQKFGSDQMEVKRVFDKGWPN